MGRLCQSIAKRYCISGFLCISLVLEGPAIFTVHAGIGTSAYDHDYVKTQKNMSHSYSSRDDLIASSIEQKQKSFKCMMVLTYFSFIQFLLLIRIMHSLL